MNLELIDSKLLKHDAKDWTARASSQTEYNFSMTCDMATPKEAPKQLIDQLPEQASWDDIMYELYVQHVSNRICHFSPPSPANRAASRRG